MKYWISYSKGEWVISDDNDVEIYRSSSESAVHSRYKELIDEKKDYVDWSSFEVETFIAETSD